jgi:hypothetical protein
MESVIYVMAIILIIITAYVIRKGIMKYNNIKVDLDYYRYLYYTNKEKLKQLEISKLESDKTIEYYKDKFTVLNEKHANTEILRFSNLEEMERLNMDLLDAQMQASLMEYQLEDEGYYKEID